MLETIPARQLTQWMEFYQLEPWGEDRADFRAGIIASTIANVNRGKNSKAFTPKDFMPNFDGQKKRPRRTLEDLKNAAMKLCIEMGGTIQTAARAMNDGRGRPDAGLPPRRALNG